MGRPIGDKEYAVGVNKVAGRSVTEHDSELAARGRVNTELQPADATIAPLGPTALALGHQDRLVDVLGTRLVAPSNTVNGAAFE